MRRSVQSVGALERQGYLNTTATAARIVRDLVREAGDKQFLLYSTVSAAFQEYPARGFMTLRRAVRAGLREEGIRVGTLNEYNAMMKKRSTPPKAAAPKRKAPKASELDQTQVQELTAKIAAMAQRDRRGRLVVLRAKVQEVLKPYPDAWRLRRAIYEALTERTIDHCTASAFDGRAERRRTKADSRIAPSSPDDEGMEEIDREVPCQEKLGLRAGFLDEDELVKLEFQLSEDTGSRRGPARVFRRAQGVKPRNRQSLADRRDVRIAAFKWLREHVDAETGEVAGPLRGLSLHLVFRSLVPYVPSTGEVRAIISALAEVELVEEYDEERAVVRVLEFLNTARPRRENVVRGG